MALLALALFASLLRCRRRRRLANPEGPSYAPEKPCNAQDPDAMAANGVDAVGGDGLGIDRKSWRLKMAGEMEAERSPQEMP